MKALCSFQSLVIILLSIPCLACPPEPPVASIDMVSPSTIYVGQTISFEGSGICPESGDIEEYQWVFPPQAYCIQGDKSPTAQCKFSPAGQYQIKLYVKSSTGLWSQEPASPNDNWQVTVTVNAATGSVWYVKPDGDDDQDGQSWASAFRCIQTAIDSASDGHEIVVASGDETTPAVYYEQLDMRGKSLHVHSEDPDELLGEWELTESTIIDAQKQGTAIIFRGNEMELISEEANIEGFTITGGFPAGEEIALHLELDETEGTTATDSSGKQRDGTLVNDPEWTTGYMGGALEFNGADEYVEVEEYKGIVGRVPRTCCTWIKTNSDQPGIILSWGAEQAGQKWTFRVEGSGKLGVGVWDGYINSTATVNNDQWHHVAAVLNNDDRPDVSEILLYIDGNLETNTYVSNSQSVDTAAS